MSADGKAPPAAGPVRETGRDAAELEALLALPPARPDRTLRYGAHPSQVTDLYGEGPPRLALLHGGFWREAYDRAHLAPLAAALARRGTPVALVEYRRVGGGGGWPETFEDVAAALGSLPGEDAVVLAGHSAGGQLALWAAACAPQRVARTVAVAPVADLGRAAELGTGGHAVAQFLGSSRLERLLPGPDPVRLPVPAAPVTLVHGEDDTQVPPELSAAYVEHSGARLESWPGVGHYAPVTAGSPAAERLSALLVSR
ncbi:alpha/beta hydrolase [Streptomyces sodiiphilus]|uniref:Alpha/beta hydrolase n=1 Tax=Streptomyces sodiiphilus TaxID=226217 RepID=A0ABN2NZ59_9ACTN